MTELDQVIAAAYASQGKQDDVNKVYLTFLRSLLFLPIQKDPSSTEEPFYPLYAQIDDNYFLLAFDTLERLTTWADNQLANMDYVQLSGRDLIAGIKEDIFFVLNAGSAFYKEFSPDEIKHLKKIVARLDQLKNS
ncbi:MAG: hypothetical protein ACD_45C00182G0003 [uncultured bacterium]|nr:MAG: hypothetical protein ACD_45C00182G0003 [uncultured bacterium]